METNIQALLDKIYEDGINKSQKESNKILESAKNESDQILGNALKEAERILEKAKSDAKILRESTEADLNNASQLVLSNLRLEITQSISKKLLDSPMKELSLDVNFLKLLIQKITDHWIQSEVLPTQIEILIPESKKTEWETTLKSVISNNLDGLKLSSSQIKSGFQIKRLDMGFRIDFTEESLKEFFRGYLTQKTSELIFKE